MSLVDDQITVVVPTSPVPSHPSTEIIEKVLASIRYHLPMAPIIVSADGVRPQVEFRRAQYIDYLKNLNQIVESHKYGNLVLRTFEQPTQQAKMLRTALETHITTPLVLFVEHDTYLVTDWNPRDTDGITRSEDCRTHWKDIAEVLLTGNANMVRFYAWEKIWHEHEYLMCGELNYRQTQFIKTKQYSQWPCIATADFYRQILREYFKPSDIVMIEPTMVSPVVTHPWEDFKIVVYHPRPNARRFYHMNARVGADGRKDPGEW